MKTVTINVTQDDIDKGQCASSSQCAVARAMSRVFPDLAIRVGSWTYGVDDGRRFSRRRLPDPVSDFILAFDTAKMHGIGSLPAPISFDIKVPNEWVTA